MGKIKGPIPIEKEASRALLPIISPIANSCCFFLIAEITTANSGRLVPIAAIKKLVINSEIFRIRVISNIECITKYVPIATPTNPRITIIRLKTFLFLGLRGHENSFLVIVLRIRINRNQEIIKKNPFGREIYPSSTAKKDKNNKRRVAAPIAKTSFLITSNCLMYNAIIPNTSVNWVKADPIESPTLMFPCPKDAEIIEFMISGRSVPRATRTKPMRIGGIAQLQASATE